MEMEAPSAGLLIFIADIFKPGVRVRLTFRKWKSTLRSFAFFCFLGHYFHFTFFAGKKATGKDAKAGKLVAVRTRGLGTVSRKTR